LDSKERKKENTTNFLKLTCQGFSLPMIIRQLSHGVTNSNISSGTKNSNLSHPTA
jgi:hypothetical protein